LQTFSIAFSSLFFSKPYISDPSKMAGKRYLVSIMQPPSISEYLTRRQPPPPGRPAKRGRPARIYLADDPVEIVKRDEGELDGFRTPSPPPEAAVALKLDSPPSGSKLSPRRAAIYQKKDIDINFSSSPSPAVAIPRKPGRAKREAPMKFFNINYQDKGYVLKDHVQLALLPEYFDYMVR
jgi:hypothetical protein